MEPSRQNALTPSQERWNNGWQRINDTMKACGTEKTLIAEDGFQSVTPKMWKLVKDILGDQPAGTKLARPRREDERPRLSRPNQHYLSPRRPLDAEKTALFATLPYSFIKDESGEVWAIEHKQAKAYIGQGTFNLMKFSFNAEGYIGCYRVSRSKQKKITTDQKQRMIVPFLGGDGFELMGKASQHSSEALAQLWLDCAHQLDDDIAHGDFKHENMVVMQDANGILRANVIDRDLREDHGKDPGKKKFSHTYSGYSESNSIARNLSQPLQSLSPSIRKLDVYALGAEMAIILRDKVVRRCRDPRTKLTSSQKINVDDASNCSISFDHFRSAQTEINPSHEVKNFLDHIAPEKICDLVDAQTQSLLELSALMVAPPDQRLPMEEVCIRLQALFPKAKMINVEVQEKIQKFMGESGTPNLLVMNTAERQRALNTLKIPGVYAENYASPRGYMNLVQWASQEKCVQAIDQFGMSTDQRDEIKLKWIQEIKPEACPSRPSKPTRFNN